MHAWTYPDQWNYPDQCHIPPFSLYIRKAVQHSIYHLVLWLCGVYDYVEFCKETLLFMRFYSPKTPHNILILCPLYKGGSYHLCTL